MSKKFVLAGFIIAGGAVMLLFFLFRAHPEREKARDGREFNLTKEDRTKLLPHEIESNREEKLKGLEQLSIVPLDKNKLKGIIERWKGMVKEKLSEIRIEGNKVPGELELNIAMSTGKEFRD